MREVHSPTGRLHVLSLDPASGRVVVDRWIDNLVTTAGRELLAQLLTGLVPGIVQVELAVGGPAEGQQPPDPYPPAAASDTNLHLPLRRAATELEVIGVVPDSVPPRYAMSISAVIPAEVGGDTLVLREAGLIMVKGGDEASPPAQPGDLASNEVLYNRVVFDTITKDPELQMTLTWEVMF
ncbi:MAG TPA: hypothetical protein VK034_02125 [Enhygromyxa sp.]|nr:hypothetical protein [Enhygromyxa sp.]